MCECKHWRSRVPQSVVHSVRAVIADAGIDVGYLIASSGFQGGSFEAAEFSNLRLVSWEGFQREFEPMWLDRYFVKVIRDELDPLFRYTEPLVPRSFLEVTEQGVEELKYLRTKHASLGGLLLGWVWHGDLGRGLPSLPLRSGIEPQYLARLEGLRNTFWTRADIARL